MNSADTPLVEPIRMTQYSHGSGCGCKLSPDELDSVLKSSLADVSFPGLMVGESTKDDAAVFDTGGPELLVSTTDFFMPVTDDPYEFGRIAAANALSDVYAMGGRPVLALAILGWPVDLLSPSEARPVMNGARELCRELGVSLAGGHSIDSPEPFFGLAVNGLVKRENLKTNANAKADNVIFLTKPIGTGLLSTAEKYSIVREKDAGLAVKVMAAVNSIGYELATIPEVSAMTDVTGFGILGHLLEMCDGANLSADLDYKAIRQITDLSYYVAAGSFARGLKENWKSYGKRVTALEEPVRSILSDPQTSGGLLIAVPESSAHKVIEILTEHGLGQHTQPVARMRPRTSDLPIIRVLNHEDVPTVTVRFGLDAAKLNLINKEKKEETIIPVINAECAPPRPAKATPGEMWKMMKGFFYDLWKYRKEIRQQARWIERFAKQKGYRVNPHWMFYANLRLWLVESEQSFGKRFCPCFEPSDDETLNKKMICPCDFIDQDIEQKGTCHCTLFGGGDLTDEGFMEAEARLMREYRVELRKKGEMVDTSEIPTDVFRGLKVPDAYHLVKRGAMLHGLPLKVFMERDFEVRNITQWAEFKGWKTVAEPEGDGFQVTIRKEI